MTSDTGLIEKGKVLGKETVNVPAGSFDDCFKIAYIMTSGSQTDTGFVYLAPDVGLVKMLFPDGTLELKEYTVK